MAAFTTTAVERFVKSRRSGGKAARDASGRERALPATSAHRGGLVAVRLPPPRRWPFGHAEDGHDRRMACPRRTQGGRGGQTTGGRSRRRP